MGLPVAGRPPAGARGRQDRVPSREPARPAPGPRRRVLPLL